MWPSTIYGLASLFVTKRKIYSYRNQSVVIFREQLPVMDQSRGGARPKKPRSQFYKNVLLLKNSNFRRIDGQVYMPTESEISTIKTSAQLRQFRKGVEFCASMSEDEVKKKLQETFPYLENTRWGKLSDLSRCIDGCFMSTFKAIAN